MTDDFSHHPETIGEARSARTDLGADWKLRDMLIWLLREIDAGRQDNGSGVIMYRSHGTTNFLQCCEDSVEMYGLVHYGLAKFEQAVRRRDEG